LYVPFLLPFFCVTSNPPATSWLPLRGYSLFGFSLEVVLPFLECCLQ
jgi:hypothetical protein